MVILHLFLTVAMDEDAGGTRAVELGSGEDLAKRSYWNLVAAM